ncbi:MAG: ABC transporter ATP-binding protein, partial [Candidatus Atribacteria bacterium]|nr:ABC transporter ATP-binding protein [Candidatus Atribacteria bacterium]
RMVIFSTSDPIDVLSMGDKVIIMDQGEILQFGNVNEVYENPKNIRVGKYFGYPEMNILETTIKDNGDKIQIEIGDQKQHLKKSVTRDYQGKYTIGIRPEDAKMISLNQQNEVLKDTFLFLKAIGIVSEVIGSDTVISSAIDKQFLTLFHPGIHIVEPDEEINVMIRKDDVLVFSAETGEIIGRGI